MKINRTRTLTAVTVALAALAVTACGSSDTATSTGATSTVASGATSSTAGPTTTAAPPGVKGVARNAAETTTGIAYGTASDSQTLDLYLPKSDGSKAVPMVVLIHGGAFKMGDSSMESSHAQALLDKGIASAAVNYRLSGEAPFPAGAQDVKAAVRWLRANAVRYGLDPDRIGAWGESAGGWMANMLGATGDQATVFDEPTANPGQSSAVRAVVSWFGPTDFTTMDTQANQTKCTSPDVHSTAGSPESVWLGEPVATSSKAQQTNLTAYVATAKALPAWFLAHGDSDCQVSPGQSAELKAALEQKGVTPTYTILPGARHADPAFDQTQLTPSVDFLVTALRG